MSAKVHKHFIEPKDCQAAQANDKLLHDSHSSRSARRRIGHAHDPGRERNIRTRRISDQGEYLHRMNPFLPDMKNYMCGNLLCESRLDICSHPASEIIFNDGIGSNPI